jgi:NCS1 family nucleobase:cation symporter-1
MKTGRTNEAAGEPVAGNLSQPRAAPRRRSGVANAVQLERRAIDYIPESERRGHPNTLLTLWFASNVQVTALATGIIAVSLGLDLKWSIISILIGNLVGGLFMAYHSVQGPRLGVAQMIQSRAQFGFFGALLPLVIVILLYLGFFITSAVLGGQAVAGLLHVPYSAGVVIGDVVVLVITWVGYDLFHTYDRFVAVFSGLMFLAIMVKLITELPAHPTPTTVTSGTVLLAISIFASWQITWAPYVSDYSRYLPADAPASRVFWFTYVGSAVGGSWAMVVGALAGLVALKPASADTSGYLAGLFPGVRPLFFFLIFLGIVAANLENLYGAFLTFLTSISATGTFTTGLRARIVFTTVGAAVGSVLAIEASSNFITNLTDFVLFLLYFLIPWTAINLTDYYLVRHGRYEITELFKTDGLYGTWNWWALAIYAVTFGIEVPFMDSSFYVGPLATSLGGGDIAWLVGLAFAVPAYYFVARRRYRLREPVP